MRRPYIGITDFATAEQTQKMLNVFAANRAPDSKRLLMVGVMMSYKTLNGIPTKWAAVWPRKQAVGDIFIQHSLALNTLHYADYESIDVLRSLRRAANWGYPRMDALQLDMIWPKPTDISVLRWINPEVMVIIQANSEALDIIDNDPQKLVEKLKEYGDAVDYVLLDKSMGRGLGMDAEGLRPYLCAVRDSGLDIGLAVAGGLGPDTLRLVEPLIAEFPDLSIDAQSKLRPSGNAMDPIDWGMAEEYLKKSLKMLK